MKILLRGTILSLILVLACTASFAQQTGTGAKGKVADSDSLAAWYEKTLQLSGISLNFHSYKPVGGTKKQEEDRSVIKLGE